MSLEGIQKQRDEARKREEAQKQTQIKPSIDVAETQQRKQTDILKHSNYKQNNRHNKHKLQLLQ